MRENKRWPIVQKNPSFWAGALGDAEGQRISWHSPSAEASSQIICISALGGLRSLPNSSDLISRLLAQAVPHVPSSQEWRLIPEYVEPRLLGETGSGNSTNIDVFCESASAVVCIEAKFLYDAQEGFGGCSQPKKKCCSGFYGPGSDLLRGFRSNCRLESQEGKRNPRLYWQLGRRFFQDRVFTVGSQCAFSGSHYQLMRNFLFAAAAAGEERQFAVVALVPQKTSSAVRKQVASFQEEILLPRFRSHVNVATYDALASLMVESVHANTAALGRFIQERASALL